MGGWEGERVAGRLALASQMGDLPGAILFACTNNTIRSPMAEAIAKHLYGHVVYVDSAGVRLGERDPFVLAVMEEIGLDLSRHWPKTLDDLEDSSYDVVITLSPEAQHNALEMTRTMACEVEFWPIFDATIVQGNREVVLDAYRGVRDTLSQRIRDRFGLVPAPRV